MGSYGTLWSEHDFEQQTIEWEAIGSQRVSLVVSKLWYCIQKISIGSLVTADACNHYYLHYY